MFEANVAVEQCDQNVEFPVSFRNSISLEGRIEAAIQTIMDLVEKGHSIVSTLSSGKDSTTTTLLCLEAIRRMSILGCRQATHYISSSSTSVENPEIEAMLLTAHEDISRWVATHALPVQVRLVEPSSASKFVVNIIGRGTLPRFVENGTKRTCSQDWKVKPQQRLAKQIMDEVMSEGFRETITVLGTRLDESVVRGASMARRGDQAQKPNRNDAGFLTLSLIADWSESDVWEFLVMFLDGQDAPFDGYAQGDTIRRMLDLYRDGNEGTCGMFLGDGKKAPCGSRFGCWTCTITGDRDKSMESMLANDSKYEYMVGLSKFRNFLVATQWDMKRRELVGRSVSEAGYIPVRPDVYNLQMRKQMLGYMLTLDELERERAEQVDADLATGKLPRTADNLRMAEPQFEIVRETDIALIDFYWSMHHYASSAFPALRMWYEVKTLGRRYSIPSLSKAEKGKGIAEKKWFPVGAFDKAVPVDGLRDYKAEMWNPYLHPERLITHREVHGKRVVWFEDADTLEVNAMEAMLFIDTYCSSSMPIETQCHDAMDSARFWLNEGIIKIPKGMIGRYQQMAKRGQYFAHLAMSMNITSEELDAHLESISIDDTAHSLLLGEIVPDTGNENQGSLFF